MKTRRYNPAHELTRIMQRECINTLDRKSKTVNVLSVATRVQRTIDPDDKSPYLVTFASQRHLVTIATTFFRRGGRDTFDDPQEPLFVGACLQLMYPSADTPGDYRTLDNMRRIDFEAAILRLRKAGLGLSEHERILVAELQHREAKGQFDSEEGDASGSSFEAHP